LEKHSVSIYRGEVVMQAKGGIYTRSEEGNAEEMDQSQMRNDGAKKV
jgi:hypothetical protein